MKGIAARRSRLFVEYSDATECGLFDRTSQNYCRLPKPVFDSWSISPYSHSSAPVTTRLSKWGCSKFSRASVKFNVKDHQPRDTNGVFDVSKRSSSMTWRGETGRKTSVFVGI